MVERRLSRCQDTGGQRQRKELRAGILLILAVRYQEIAVDGAINRQETAPGAASECPLCGERRRYLPSEVFLARVDQLVNRQKRAGAI